MTLTVDRTDPDLGHGIDAEERDQQSKYLVLSEEERAKGFVRPLRDSYVHMSCGTVTTMAYEIAATYARSPSFYGATYCCRCRRHLPLHEFFWVQDGEITDQEVGS